MSEKNVNYFEIHTFAITRIQLTHLYKQTNSTEVVWCPVARSLDFVKLTITFVVSFVLSATPQLGETAKVYR